MVSVKAFDTIFPNLTQYYGKTEAFADNNLALAAWVEALKQITDQEFMIAAKKCIKQHRFLPTAEEFVELITGGDELLAIEEWQKILDWNYSYGGLQRISRDLPPLMLSPHGEKTLRKIGGLQAINNLQPNEKNSVEEKLRFLEKEFIKYWIEYKRAIGVGQIEPPPPMLQQAPQPEEPQKEFIPAPEGAFDKMLEKMMQTHPAFAERLLKSRNNPVSEKQPSLSPKEVQQNRQTRQEIYADSAQKFSTLLQ